VKEAPPTIAGASNNRFFPRKAFGVLIGMLLLGGAAWFVLPVVGLIVTPICLHYQVQAGFEKARRTIEPKWIIAWASREVLKYPLTNEPAQVVREIPVNDLPDSLQNLFWFHPTAVRICKYDVTRPANVQVVWGGGFYDWRLIIGQINSSENSNYGYWTTNLWFTMN
jgi:hypothetical protein